MRLAPMLSHSGRLMGDLSIARLGAARYWIVGSYYLQEWHQRWFDEHRPAQGVEIENLSESWLGFSLSGPRSREILASLTRADVSHRALPFLGCSLLDLGFASSVVARVSLTGELGYEINVPAERQRALWDALMAVGTPLGMRPIGMRAQDSLRLEKGYGVWSLEYSTAYTPAESGLDRFITADKGDFMGRAAFVESCRTAPGKKLVLLQVDSPDADVTGYEPIRQEGRPVGYVTSGAYGHHVGASLALGYIDGPLARTTDPLTVSVIGVQRAARVLPAPPYDPSGARLRS
jgi:dimethylglycine dehydrogenase